MIVPANFLDEFKTIASPLSVKKKEFLVKEGETARYLGIIEQGSMFSYLENRDLERQINGLYGPLSVVSSYRSFLTQTPSVGVVQAYADSELWVISFARYEQLMDDPHWIRAFKWIGDQLYIEKCRKQTSLTTLAPLERHRLLLEEFPSIELLFPQHMIASLLNIRPETLSRLKSLDLCQDKS